MELQNPSYATCDMLLVHIPTQERIFKMADDP